jgi:hypothetical protein
MATTAGASAPTTVIMKGDAIAPVSLGPRGGSPPESTTDLHANGDALELAAAAERAAKHAAELHAAEFDDSEPPTLLKGAFDPSKVLGGDPAGEFVSR